jgi:hypothetical protein
MDTFYHFTSCNAMLALPCLLAAGPLCLFADGPSSSLFSSLVTSLAFSLLIFPSFLALDCLVGLTRFVGAGFLSILFTCLFDCTSRHWPCHFHDLGLFYFMCRLSIANIDEHAFSCCGSALCGYGHLRTSTSSGMTKMKCHFLNFGRSAHCMRKDISPIFT